MLSSVHTLCTVSLCEALDTCADDQPRAHWPRLMGSDRNPHVYRLAWCSGSRPAGRKIRSGLWCPPFVSSVRESW